MSHIFSGAMIGLLMASIFISAGMLTLFFLLKDPPRRLVPIFDRFSPGGIAMSVVVVSYPFWAFVGGILGLLYKYSLTEAPGGGIGSPNFRFTLLIVVTTVVFATPVAILMRRQALFGVLTIAIMFMGIFGWLLPHFAA